MAQGPSGTILVAIRITLRIRESKVRNPDAPDRWRFVVSEHSLSSVDTKILDINVTHCSSVVHQSRLHSHLSCHRSNVRRCSGLCCDI